MKDQALAVLIKEEWQKEKAPADLIIRTKEAVAAYKGQPKRKIRYYAAAGITAIAATLLFLIFLPGLKNSQVIEETTGTWLKLGRWTEDEALYLEETVSMERMTILPLYFMQAKEEIYMGDMPVLFVQDADGFWQAAFWEQDAYVVILSRTTDEEQMHEIMDKILSTAD